MMAQYLIGIDVGSSDCKVVITDTRCEIIAQSSRAYPTLTPKLDWAEQHPEDWYRIACETTRDCLTQSAIRPSDVAAIAIDGPAHNVALMDQSGEILCPTIHWSDLRSAPQTEWLEAEYGDLIFNTTYCQANPAWTLPQLLWLKENEPAIWSKLRRIQVTKDYVRYRLTGNYQTDVYDAIGTQLYDVEAGAWSKTLCDILGFNADWLPVVAPANAIGGELQPEPARAMGLPGGIPVAVGSGDSVVEAFGVGAIHPGDCIVKLGTAANVNLVTGDPHISRQSITYRHVVDSRWFTITATNAGASTMRWFRDTFCRLESEQAQREGVGVYELIDQLSQDAPAGCDGLLFHPYLKGERSPHWDPNLRGDFAGINAQHTIHHFARAVLEGVDYSIRDCLGAVKALGQPIHNYTLIGGGSKSKLWRRILCDILGESLRTPRIDSAALGSAMLAGVATGVYSDWEAATRQCVRIEDHIDPDPDKRELYDSYFSVYQAFSTDLARHSRRLVEIAQAYQHIGDVDENKVTERARTKGLVGL
jgi:xylulokinase